MLASNQARYAGARSNGHKICRLESPLRLLCVERAELVDSLGCGGDRLVSRITGQARDRYIPFHTFNQGLAMASVVLLKLDLIPLLGVLNGSAERRLARKQAIFHIVGRLRETKGHPALGVGK